MEISEVIAAVIILLVCVVPLALIFFAYYFWLPGRDAASVRKEQEKYIKALLERGVTSPADVLSVTHVGHKRKQHGGTEERALVYTLEVHPEGQPSFQTKLETWRPTWRYQSAQWLELQRRDEEVKKIWVTYDPNTPSQMVIHHFDYEHEKIMDKKDWVERRNAFIDFESETMKIRDSGEESLAVILEAEDINVATEEEKKEASTMRMKFNVTPKSGLPFESETYGMVANESLKKLSVGKKVYVKFNPGNLGKVALMRSAE